MKRKALKFGTYCSGIDAPGTAWKKLGWIPLFVSEIEPFPCAVLDHHNPGVPNLGDMEKITDEVLSQFDPDVVCAGTPCQSFSVAGLRKGMDDPRGNLALVFLRLIDKQRPRWVVWENVPGVHSSWSDEATFAASEQSYRNVGSARRAVESAGIDLGANFGIGEFEEVDQSNDFDCFVAALEKLGYGVATRVFDAQYAGVPQRRRRVFVVGYLGNWRCAAAVLLERHGLSGNPPPSREAGQRIAACLTRGAESGGKGGYSGRRQEDDFNIVANCVDAHVGCGGPDDNAAQANHLVPVIHADVSPALKARDYKGPSSDGDGDGDGAILVPMISHSLRADGFDASEDGTGRGTPIVPVRVCGTLNSNGRAAGSATQQDAQSSLLIPVAFDATQITSSGNYSNPKPGDPCHPLAAFAHPPAVAYQCHGSNVGEMGVLRSGNGNETGGVPFITTAAIPILEVGKGSSSRGAGLNGCGIGQAGDPMFTLQAGAQHAVAFDWYASESQSLPVADVCPPLKTTMQPAVSEPEMAVRRMTPMECERLQGFPDDFTAIKFRGKPAADAPRYKAIGNSMAVPELKAIGERIQLLEDLIASGEISGVFKDAETAGAA